MKRKMEDKQFKKLLKEKTPKELIRGFIHSEYNFTSKQLDKCIELKNKQKK